MRIAEPLHYTPRLPLLPPHPESVSHRVFIDGQAGTTGLEIHARLRGRTDLELLEIEPARRKDAAARRELLNEADAVVLCLPDAAAREAVTLIERPGVRVLDASTAHRVDPDWAYGLPELDALQRTRIAAADRVSNPGCYPTGFILAVRPLVEAGWIDAAAPLSVHAISGYTGGGRELVERYEGWRGAGIHTPPRPYGLGLAHKHLPEMQQYAGISEAPLFSPLVGDFARGMLVQIPLQHSVRARPADPDLLTAALAERYADEPCVAVHAPGGADALIDGGFLDPQACNGSNRVDLMVFGHADQQLLVARLDNLGKGAGGGAIQNLNLMLGAPEHAGISISAADAPPARAIA